MDQVDQPRLHLILLAGGLGKRVESAQDQMPKQFRATDRGPLFYVSLREFLGLKQARIMGVTVVVTAGWEKAAAGSLAELAIPWQLAAAGPTRTASTFAAVELLTTGNAAIKTPQPEDLVAVHDAARPFATVDLLGRLVAAAAEHGGAVPGIPVADTIIQSGTGEGSVQYLSRSTLNAVQTPQVFRWGQFSAAHRWAATAGVDWTDDGGLLAERGHPPVVVLGEPENWKITTTADWRRAQTLLQE